MEPTQCGKMTDALAHADVHNIFVAAKRFASKCRVVHLGEIADVFKSRVAAMDTAARDALRAEFPGRPNKVYKFGWRGAWDRFLDSDPEVAGDSALASSTMERYLKFFPVARELLARDRADAIPLKLSSRCDLLKGAISVLHAHECPPAARDAMVRMLADALEACANSLGRAATMGQADSATLAAEIERLCTERGIDLGEIRPPAKQKSAPPAKRARRDFEATGDGATDDRATDDGGADDGGAGDGGTDCGAADGGSADDGSADNGGECAPKRTSGDGRGSDLFALIMRAAEEDADIALEVSRELGDMIPGIVDGVRRKRGIVS